METALNIFSQLVPGRGHPAIAGKPSAEGAGGGASLPALSNTQGEGGATISAPANFLSLLNIIHNTGLQAEGLTFSADPVLEGQEKSASKSAAETVISSFLQASSFNAVQYNTLPGIAAPAAQNAAMAVTNSDGAQINPALKAAISGQSINLTPPANPKMAIDGGGALAAKNDAANRTENALAQGAPYQGAEIASVPPAPAHGPSLAQSETVRALTEGAAPNDAGLVSQSSAHQKIISNKSGTPAIAVTSEKTGQAATYSANRETAGPGIDLAYSLTGAILAPTEQEPRTGTGIQPQQSSQPLDRLLAGDSSPATDKNIQPVTAGVTPLALADSHPIIGKHHPLKQVEASLAAQPETASPAQSSQPIDPPDLIPVAAAFNQPPGDQTKKPETQAGQADSSGPAANTSLVFSNAPLVTAVNPTPVATVPNPAVRGQEEGQQSRPLKNGRAETPALKDRPEVTSSPAGVSAAAPKPGQNAASLQSAPAEGQSFAQTLTQQPSTPVPAKQGMDEIAASSQPAKVEAGGAVVTERQDPLRTPHTASPIRTETQPHPVSPPIRDIAVHIAQHADSGVNRFQLRLDPPELGRVEVRMEISPEGKLSAVIAVERAETLDLLQRDSRTLERSLEEAGLKTGNNSLNFSLKGGRQENYAQESPSHNRTGSDAPLTDDYEVSLPVPSYRFASRAVNITI